MNHGAPLNLVFMLEEESARHLLEALLPRISGKFSSINYKCIPHPVKQSHIFLLDSRLHGSDELR